MLLKIISILALLAVVFVVVVSFRPADFRVSRSITIAAPPAVVFPHVDTLRQWHDWSPWAKADPSAVVTFDGPPAGVGASYRWTGKKTGEGTMTTTSSQSDSDVRFRLEFVKPFAATNDVEFSFLPQGNGTVVTWTMTGKNNFLAKAINLVIDCEKMCGTQFDQGLADLKTIAEKEAKP
ncbi:MAG: SRPBCC family protein [Chthoniobacteraceae bacterium]